MLADGPERVYAPGRFGRALVERIFSRVIRPWPIRNPSRRPRRPISPACCGAPPRCIKAGNCARPRRFIATCLPFAPISSTRCICWACSSNRPGEPAEALKLIGKALASNDRSAVAHSNRGIVLAALSRNEEALASYQAALALKPDYVDALYNRGNAFYALGRATEALASFERALALKPDYADALLNRAQILHDLGRAPEALDSIERALALKPDHAAALALRGRLLTALKRDAEALVSFERALALKPDDADTLVARGNLHYAMKSFAAALADCERGLLLRPDAAPLHSNRGNALRELGRQHEALASFDRALALDPDYADASSNRGNALLELNRAAEALADYDRALALQAGFHLRAGQPRHCLALPQAFRRSAAKLRPCACAFAGIWPRRIGTRACYLLELGDFARGLPEYEWRWRRDGEMKPRDFAQPLWRGEDLAGKTMLLHAEQGFGDSIQFLRYVPMVVAKGGKRGAGNSRQPDAAARPHRWRHWRWSNPARRCRRSICIAR